VSGQQGSEDERVRDALECVRFRQATMPAQHEQFGRERVPAWVAEWVEHLEGRAVAARGIDRMPHRIGRAEHDGLDQPFTLEDRDGADDPRVRAFRDRDPMTQLRCTLPYTSDEGAHRPGRSFASSLERTEG
jgi:hypothetical protein